MNLLGTQYKQLDKQLDESLFAILCKNYDYFTF